MAACRRLDGTDLSGALGLIFLLLALAPLPAWADAEQAHPLTDRPVPSLRGLSARPPFALLLWQRGDGRPLRRLGEAKLVELASSNQALSVHSVEITGGTGQRERPYGNGIVKPAAIAPVEFARLQARSPVIITVDQQGRIHRVSQVDHWPSLSALDPRFGTIGSRTPSAFERFLDWLKRR